MRLILRRNKGNFKDDVVASYAKLSAVYRQNKPWPFRLWQRTLPAMLKRLPIGAAVGCAFRLANQRSLPTTLPRGKCEQALNYYILTAVALFAPAVAVFATNWLVPLLMAGCILPVSFAIREKQWRSFLSLPAAKILLLFIGVAVASALWSLSPLKGLVLSLKLAVFFVAVSSLFLWLKSHPRPGQALWVENAFLAGAAAALVLVGVEWVTKGAVSTMLHHKETYRFEPYLLNKGATCLVLFAWVVVFILLRRQRTGWALAWWAASAYVLYFLDSNAAAFAYAVATLLFLCALVWRRKAIRGWLVLFVPGMVALPFLMLAIQAETMGATLPQLPESAKHRLYIWEYASHKALERPFLGWGVDSARHFPVDAKDITHPVFYPLPNHPHNSVLQVWFELGAMGLFLFVGTIAALIRAIERLEGNVPQATASAVLASYLVVGFFSYNIWQSWWLAAGWLAVVFIRVGFLLPMPAPTHIIPAPSAPPGASVA